MKKSIKIQGSVALFLVGLGFCSSGFTGCSVIDPTPPPCNCKCQCALTGGTFCHTDPAGSPACRDDCLEDGAAPNVCHDIDAAESGGSGGSGTAGSGGAAGKAGSAGAGGSAGTCQ